MKKHIIIFVCLAFAYTLFAQDNASVILSDIEKNNTTLQALKSQMEANVLENKTNIYLANPEVEFNYLWGKPSTIGNRKDFSVSQSFDFPTAYAYRSKIASLKNEQVQLEYKKQLRDIRFEAQLLLADLVFYNAQTEELSKRMVHAESIAKSYQSQFNVGEANILEYNKAQLYKLTTAKELEAVQLSRNAVLSELSRLNGGIRVEFSASSMTQTLVSFDFEQWYAATEQNNPSLLYLKKELEINQKQVNLSLAQALPKFKAGYMSETVVGQQFQGLSVGMSIPLWENKNQIKHAKAQAIATESSITDSKLQFYMKLKTLHTKFSGLQKNVNDYRSSLQELDNSVLLKKALVKGEISLINYLVELSIYYESMNKLLELERELNKTAAELKRFE